MTQRYDMMIHVIDGQNETEILNHQQNYNPCLPISFAAEYDITLTFDPDNINNLNDWYPTQLCESQVYKNQYMFDGAGSFTISNLIIIDYTIHNESYSFIRTDALYNNATIKCINCTFKNITSTANVDLESLFLTYSNIFLIDNEFIDVNIYNINSLIRADYSDDAGTEDKTPRAITIERSIFTNITSLGSIVLISYATRDVKHLFKCH